MVLVDIICNELVGDFWLNIASLSGIIGIFILEIWFKEVFLILKKGFIGEREINLGGRDDSGDGGSRKRVREIDRCYRFEN